MGVKVSGRSGTSGVYYGTSGTSGIGTPGSSGASGSSGTSGSSGASVSGSINYDLYYDEPTSTLYTPNICLTGSTVTITNIQNTDDNETKLILSGNTLYQVTGVTSQSGKIRLITTGYTLAEDDDMIIVSGSTDLNINMPPISGSSFYGYTIKNVTTNMVNIITYGTETIDDELLVTISRKNTSITLKPYNGKWYII